MLLTDESRQGGLADSSEGCAAKQRDPDRLEKQAGGTSKFSKVLHLERGVTGRRAVLNEKSPNGIEGRNM